VFKNIIGCTDWL